MSKRELMKTIFSTAKQGVKFAMEHREAVAEVLKGSFSAQMIKHLRDHELKIPESAIMAEMKKYEKNETWHVSSLNCLDDSMTIAVTGRVAGAGAEAFIRLKMEELVINEEMQMVRCRIQEEHLGGNDLWGKIVCGIVNVCTDHFFRKAVEQSAYRNRVVFSEDGTTVTVSLAGIPAVAALCEKKIPQWDDSVPLRMASLNGIKHCDGGLILLFTVSEQIEKIVEHCSSAKDLLATGIGILRKMKGTDRDSPDDNGASQQ